MKLKQNEIGKDFCPCCGHQMFLLENGTWTHRLGEAFREATKRDNLKGAIKFDESDKADKILEKLGKLKCDFSSVKSGDIEDLKKMFQGKKIEVIAKDDVDDVRFIVYHKDTVLGFCVNIKNIKCFDVLHEISKDALKYNKAKPISDDARNKLLKDCHFKNADESDIEDQAQKCKYGKTKYDKECYHCKELNECLDICEGD